MVLNSHFLYSDASTLLGEMKTVHKKTFPASASIAEEYLSAQVPHTKIFLPSVKTVLFNIMSLFF